MALSDTFQFSDNPNIKKMVILQEAIGDPLPLTADAGEHESAYDFARRKEHLSRYGSGFSKRSREFNSSRKLMNHVSRPDSARDLRGFKLLQQGESSAAAVRDRG